MKRILVVLFLITCIGCTRHDWMQGPSHRIDTTPEHDGENWEGVEYDES